MKTGRPQYMNELPLFAIEVDGVQTVMHAKNMRAVRRYIVKHTPLRKDDRLCWARIVNRTTSAVKWYCFVSSKKRHTIRWQATVERVK